MNWFASKLQLQLFYVSQIDELFGAFVLRMYCHFQSENFISSFDRWADLIVRTRGCSYVYCFKGKDCYLYELSVIFAKVRTQYLFEVSFMNLQSIIQEFACWCTFLIAILACNIKMQPLKELRDVRPLTENRLK